MRTERRTDRHDEANSRPNKTVNAADGITGGGATVSMGEPGDFPFTWFQVVTSLTNQALYMPVFYVLMDGNTF